MTKKWEKIDEGKYKFTIDNQLIGYLTIVLNSTSQTATCEMENETFFINRTGFWKNNLEVINHKKQIIAKTYNEKWYANSSILQYNNKI